MPADNNTLWDSLPVKATQAGVTQYLTNHKSLTKEKKMMAILKHNIVAEGGGQGGSKRALGSATTINGWQWSVATPCLRIRDTTRFISTHAVTYSTSPRRTKQWWMTGESVNITSLEPAGKQNAVGIQWQDSKALQPVMGLLFWWHNPHRSAGFPSAERKAHHKHHQLKELVRPCGCVLVILISHNLPRGCWFMQHKLPW